MRAKWAMVIAAVCVVAVASSLSAAAWRIAVYVDGQQVQADAILHNGRTYLPARAIAEALGCSVHWDPRAKAVYIEQRAATGEAASASGTPAVSTSATPTSRQASHVYITDTGARYHRTGCRYLSESKISVTREEATAQGYTPCTVCKP